MNRPKRASSPTPALPERAPSSSGCDRPHPPVPGERPTMDLGAAELFVVASLRAWVAPIRAPGVPHPDWRGVMRLADVSGAPALAFHHLMSAIAHKARRSLDVRCPACPSLGADEEAMLALVASLQACDALAALDMLADWLPDETAVATLRHARDFAEGCAEVGMRLPLAPSHPALLRCTDQEDAVPGRPIIARRVLLAAPAVLIAARPRPARAWATRPVRLIVGSGAGGNADVVARLLAAALEEDLGQRVLVENLPAVAGSRAVEAVARAEPDGHTLLFGTISQLVMNLALFDNLPVDAERDVRGVAMVNRVPMALLVPPAEPAPDLAAFLARLRAEGPSRFQYGSGPRGTTTHIVGALFADRAGLPGIVHVPYQASAQSLTDLSAGRLTFLFDALVTALPPARAGTARILGVASGRRSAAAPDLPTIAEAGLPGFVGATWNSVSAPAALPDALAERISAAVTTALARPALRRRLAELGAEPEPALAPREVDAFYRRERELWLPVVRASGARAG